MEFDPDTEEWSDRGGEDLGGGGTLVIAAPDGSKIAVFSTLAGTRFITVGSWSKVTGSSFPWSQGSTDYNHVAAYDSTRDQYLLLGWNNTQQATDHRLLTVNWSANTFSAPVQSLSGSSDALSECRGGAALWFDVARDCYWCLGCTTTTATGSIAYITEIDAETFAATRHTLGTAISCNSQMRGLFGKFLWMPRFRTVAIAARSSDAVRLIRLPG